MLLFISIFFLSFFFRFIEDHFRYRVSVFFLLACVCVWKMSGYCCDTLNGRTKYIFVIMIMISQTHENFFRHIITNVLSTETIFRPFNIHLVHFCFFLVSFSVFVRSITNTFLVRATTLFFPWPFILFIYFFFIFFFCVYVLLWCCFCYYAVCDNGYFCLRSK